MGRRLIEAGARGDTRMRRPAAAPGQAACRFLSRNAVSWDFDSAPTFVSATAPFLNNINVGMPRMPYLAGTVWFSSTLSLAIVRRPLYSPATSSRIGAIILQGPHHSAQ